MSTHTHMYEYVHHTTLILAMRLTSGPVGRQTAVRVRAQIWAGRTTAVRVRA